MASVRGLVVVALVVMASSFCFINVVMARDQGSVITPTPLYEGPSYSSHQKMVLQPNQYFSVNCHKQGNPGTWYYVLMQSGGMSGYLPQVSVKCGVSGCNVPETCPF